MTTLAQQSVISYCGPVLGKGVNTKKVYRVRVPQHLFDDFYDFIRAKWSGKKFQSGVWENDGENNDNVFCWCSRSEGLFALVIPIGQESKFYKQLIEFQQDTGVVLDFSS
ncbi:MAG: hypothetical protein ACKKL5_00420 [Candidatus Komeilibacteria bacterium]